jgi:hypothetical protein
MPANASKCALPAAADLREAGVVGPTQEKGFDQGRLHCASVHLGLNNVFAVALLVYVFVILVTLGHHGECVSQHCVIGEAATGVFVRRVQVRNAGHDASVCRLCTPEGFNTRALGLIQARTTSSTSRWSPHERRDGASVAQQVSTNSIQALLKNFSMPGPSGADDSRAYCSSAFLTSSLSLAK